jgi:hypothetical protein
MREHDSAFPNDHRLRAVKSSEQAMAKNQAATDPARHRSRKSGRFSAKRSHCFYSQDGRNVPRIGGAAIHLKRCVLNFLQGMTAGIASTGSVDFNSSEQG